MHAKKQTAKPASALSKPDQHCATSRHRLLAVVRQIRRFCAAHGEPSQVARYARFFTEGYDAYGLSLQTYESARDAFLKQHRDALGLAGFLTLGEMLIASGKYEEASFALGFLVPFVDHFDVGTFQRVGHWLQTGLRNWAHTDTLCSWVLSPCLEQGHAAVADLADWRSSASKWKRRAVPVALVPLAKTTRDIRPLLEFIEPMMHDHERVVHQGLGWFLREAWKSHPAPTEVFLRRWKNSAPRLIFQYATEKMAPAQKARFRREQRT